MPFNLLYPNYESLAFTVNPSNILVPAKIAGNANKIPQTMFS